MVNEKRLIYAKLAQHIADVELTPEEAGVVQWVLSHTPTVDAVEVVHGRWIPTYHTYYNREGASEIADEWHCSECGIYSRSESNYCPNCGSKMDGGAV